jgi:hypothetical protein
VVEHGGASSEEKRRCSRNRGWLPALAGMMRGRMACGAPWCVDVRGTGSFKGGPELLGMTMGNVKMTKITSVASSSLGRACSLQGTCTKQAI